MYTLKNSSKLLLTYLSISIYRNIFEMEISFNCSVLSNTFNILDHFSVNIYKDNNEKLFTELDDKKYDFENFKVDHLKDYICVRRNVASSDKHTVKLWKVNVDTEEVSIGEELFKEEMKSQKLFHRYFESKSKN